MLTASVGAGAASAQNLIGGGLTNLPVVQFGPDQAANGGFETLSGGVPANWSAGSGWAADQIIKRTGAFSFRRGPGSPTSQQTVQVKKGIYRFSAWIKTENVGSGTGSGMRLQFDFRPTPDYWVYTDVISGTRDWTFYELRNIVVTTDSTITLKLENYNGAGGTAWFDDVRLEEQLPQAVDVFLLHPNFRGMLFDDQPQGMRFDVTVTPPNGDFGAHRVTGTLRDEATGAVVATQNYAAAGHFVATLDGSGMQPGRAYLATFALVNIASNQAVYTYPAYRVSKVPASRRQTMNVSFDAKNRVLVKGVPRFVLGVYDSGLGYSGSDAFWENALWSPTGDRRMEGLQINFYLNYWMGQADATSMKALMANLQKRNVVYLQTGNCFARFPAGGNFMINSSDAYVQDIGSHAGSAGYYTVDECDSSLVPGVFNQYRRLRQLDPDSVTFSTNFGNPDLDMWRDSADIMSTDPYPLFAAEPASGYNHAMVGDWTRLTRQAVKDARPFMTVLQFFKFTSLGRWPTLQEMRSHAYMAIVEGARGLFWWSLGDNALRLVCQNTWCPERTGYMNNLKSVVNEIAALEQVLLADDAPGAGGTSNANIRTKVKLHNGRGYIFAYNATRNTVSATFNWNTAPGTVTVNAEGRTVGASGNSFTDSFGPFQAHVYVIGAGGTGGGGTQPPPPPPPPPSAGTPSVAFTNPAASATVSGSTTVTMTGSGGSGGYTYRLSLDGAPIYTGANGTFSWNTLNAANGAHTLTATATDSNGAVSPQAARAVTVSNGTSTPPPAPAPPPPTGTARMFITQPAANATVSGNNWAVVWLENVSGTNTVTLASNGITLASYTGASRGPISMMWDTRRVPNGTQTLTGAVVGASSGSTTRTVNVQNGTSTAPPPAPAPTPAPTPTLTAGFSSPGAGATVSGTTTVGMTVSGATTTSRTFRLSVDGVLVSTQTVSGNAASFSLNTTTLSNAAHTLSVTVTDGTRTSAAVTRSIIVSNAAAPPTTGGGLRVFITQPTGGTTVRGTAWVVMWVEGTTGSSNTFTLSRNGTVIGTQTVAVSGPVVIPWTTTTVGNGSHALTGTVRDATGKTGSANVTVTVGN